MDEPLQEQQEPRKQEPKQELNISEEMASVPFEPLLPAEKKLIAWSLVIGVSLLVLLWWFLT